MRLSLSCLRSRIILQFQHEEKNNFIVCIENMRCLFVVDHSLFLFLARSLASNQPFCVEEFDKRARARSQKKTYAIQIDVCMFVRSDCDF